MQNDSCLTKPSPLLETEVMIVEECWDDKHILFSLPHVSSPSQRSFNSTKPGSPEGHKRTFSQVLLLITNLLDLSLPHVGQMSSSSIPFTQSSMPSPSQVKGNGNLPDSSLAGSVSLIVADWVCFIGPVIAIRNIITHHVFVFI